MLTAARRDWLSITPEPERELPRAIATLKSGGPPSAEAVERERQRAERLVLRGRRRRWLAWLRETEQLARSGGAQRSQAGLELETSDEESLAAAREIVLAVIGNHDALMRGLPGKSPVGPRAQKQDGRP